jgi:hypothetical protein
MMTDAIPNDITFARLDQLDPDAWASLVRADPTSTPFHAYEWLRCLAATYPAWHVGALVRRRGGALAAALPVVRRRRLGVTVVESLPFGVYGGPVGAMDREALVGELFASGGPLSLVRLVDPTGRVPALPGTRRRPASAAVIDLSAGYETVARSYARNVKKNLHRARQRAVRVRPVTDETGARTFWDLASYTYRLHGARMPYPVSLYENIVRHIAPAGRALFELAYLDDVAIAGALHLRDDRQMVNWLTPAYRERQDVRANTLLIDSAIRAACDGGIRTYNLGASPEGEAGLVRFKRTWGARDQEYAVLVRRGRALDLVAGVLRRSL